MGWAIALTGGAAVARRWAAWTGRGWVGAVVGALTAAAGSVATPAVRAVLAVLTALAELVAGTLPATPPPAI